VVIAVSDGENSASNLANYNQTLAVLLNSDVTVYALGVDAALADRNKSALARYAHMTGGDVFHASRNLPIEDLYPRATEQARHRYTLGYVPAGSRRLGYHTIEVRVRRPGLLILARDGYHDSSVR
jgi:hypothetical protein